MPTKMQPNRSPRPPLAPGLDINLEQTPIVDPDTFNSIEQRAASRRTAAEATRPQAPPADWWGTATRAQQDSAKNVADSLFVEQGKKAGFSDYSFLPKHSQRAGQQREQANLLYEAEQKNIAEAQARRDAMSVWDRSPLLGTALRGSATVGAGLLMHRGAIPAYTSYAAGRVIHGKNPIDFTKIDPKNVPNRFTKQAGGAYRYLRRTGMPKDIDPALLQDFLYGAGRPVRGAAGATEAVAADPLRRLPYSMRFPMKEYEAFAASRFPAGSGVKPEKFLTGESKAFKIKAPAAIKAGENVGRVAKAGSGVLKGANTSLLLLSMLPDVTSLLMHGMPANEYFKVKEIKDRQDAERSPVQRQGYDQYDSTIGPARP